MPARVEASAMNDALKKACPLLVVGGGNMGQALGRGWLSAGLTKSDIIVVQPNAAKRQELGDDFTVLSSLDELTVAPAACVLAMKPKSFHGGSAGLREWLANADCLIMSVMAGTPIATIQEAAPNANIARVMPNTPSIVGQGMSVVCAPSLPDAQADIVSELFGCVGKVAWLNDEEKMHAATAISGSGPAYVFAFMEALRDAAMEMGLGASMADVLVRQTVLGAASQASDSIDALEILRQAVTSPGGTTAAGLEKLCDADNGIKKLLGFTTLAAEARSRDMANE